MREMTKEFKAAQKQLQETLKAVKKHGEGHGRRRAPRASRADIPGAINGPLTKSLQKLSDKMGELAGDVEGARACYEDGVKKCPVPLQVTRRFFLQEDHEPWHGGNVSLWTSARWWRWPASSASKRASRNKVRSLSRASAPRSSPPGSEATPMSSTPDIGRKLVPKYVEFALAFTGVQVNLTKTSETAAGGR